MTDRERFEAFALVQCLPETGRRPDGRYWSSHTDMAWEFWQASRKQALEEAIEEAEGSAKAYMGYARGGDNSGASDHKADALVDFAEELRALANPEGEQG